jgi:hypothetical protein
MSWLASKGMAWLMDLLAIAAVLSGTWFAGYHAGEKQERVAQQAGQALALAAEHQLYVDQVERGAHAAADLLAQLAAQRASIESLDRRLANVPRFAPTAACPNPAGAQLSRAGVVRLNAALGFQELPASASAAAGAAAGVGATGALSSASPEPGHGLTADAQWAQPAGVNAEQAQLNAEINFGRCTTIRTRCLALIDYIKSQPTDAADGRNGVNP